MDAVLRCEGDAAGLRRSRGAIPSLARAAEAARAAGAPDALILEAIALARAGETLGGRAAAPRRRPCAWLSSPATRADEADRAAAAWATGAVVAGAGRRAAAERIAGGGSARCAAAST